WMSNVASGIRRASAARAGPSVSKSATTTSGCSTSRIGMNARAMTSESSYGRKRSCVLPTMIGISTKRRPSRAASSACCVPEEKHADHWAKMLSDAGFPDLKKPRLPLRVKALSFLARRFGADAVLPLVLRLEASDAERYDRVAEAPDSMAGQERMHGRIVSALQGGTAGNRIARSE